MTADAPDWEGQTMLDQAGKGIGTIEEIYLVAETGRPDWAPVSVAERRTTLVPLAGARPSAEGVRAACDTALVYDAPGIDGEPSQQHVTDVYRHYGIAYDDDGRQTGRRRRPARSRRAHSSEKATAHARDRAARGAIRPAARR